MRIHAFVWFFFGSSTPFPGTNSIYKCHSMSASVTQCLQISSDLVPSLNFIWILSLEGQAEPTELFVIIWPNLKLLDTCMEWSIHKIQLLLICSMFEQYVLHFHPKPWYVFIKKIIISMIHLFCLVSHFKHFLSKNWITEILSGTKFWHYE